MGRALSYLGMARKAGFLEIGEEQSGIATRSGKAKALMLASDASENALRRAQGFAHGRNIVLLSLPYTKEELSLRLGKGGCSMVSVTDIGLASEIADALRDHDPEKYTEASETLRSRRGRFEKRRSEAKARERNKRTGKGRTKI